MPIFRLSFYEETHIAWRNDLIPLERRNEEKVNEAIPLSSLFIQFLNVVYVYV